MKNIFFKFFLIFAIFFQIELVAEEKNYHKELITDWSRIFPDGTGNGIGGDGKNYTNFRSWKISLKN